MTKSLVRQVSHAAPLHEQIYGRIRALIEDGQLKPGEQVPSLRAYAMELGVARGTVEAAYERLVGEGYLVTRSSSGTFVMERPGSPQVRAAKATPRARRTPLELATDELSIETDGIYPVPLQMGLPALDKFPRKLWARLVALQARNASLLTKPPPAGYGPLREALAAYLQRSRGLDVRERHIYVLPAFTASLSLIVDALMLAGKYAWVEFPGYPPTAQTLKRRGVHARNVPVDDDGINVEYGVRHFSKAHLAVVTPSHQCPTGVALSLERRLKMLEWAEKRGAWIVEDDYDGEFRYRGHSVPALRSLDNSDRVFYCGTLSKVLSPGLRLSYLVVPPSQVPVFDIACRHTAHGGSPVLLQAVAAMFIAEGHFSRHVKRMRTLYAGRRAMLAQALAPYRENGFAVRLQDAGMHLLVDVRDDLDDEAMARRARQAGFGLHSLTAWRHGKPGRRGLMMGFTNLRSQAEADRLVADLMAVLLA
ncbi:PLP-dependent aminotransferase family protein [Cupriavidus oxalaticus]|uniref:MocR-like pyridoxine biosynthesis transcription factor PdxR n=1 Tax=Cupriavidus oxalaticus TaxID=96344 RepID=UPI003178240B